MFSQSVKFYSSINCETSGTNVDISHNLLGWVTDSLGQFGDNILCQLVIDKIASTYDFQGLINTMEGNLRPITATAKIEIKCRM